MRNGAGTSGLTLSVVVPVYNSEMNLHELVKRLYAVLRSHSSKWELILVNDDSRDASWDRVRELVSQHDWVRGIALMRNYGQHNALLCGIRAAQYEIVITMDDDLQNPPEEIPAMLEKLAEGYDVVYGTPQKEQHGLWRDLASQVTKLALQSAMGAKTARDVSAFRAFRTPIRDAFAGYTGPFASIDVLLTWGTTRFSAVPVKQNPRLHGVSNYTVGRLIRHALNMMTGFSVMPLELASMMGFAFTLFGMGVLGFVLLRYLMVGDAVQGFPFLASIIAIFSGAQLFALGIVGEYLAGMHFRMMKRPCYVVRERAQQPETQEFASAVPEDRAAD